jgi:hypothetical protein
MSGYVRHGDESFDSISQKAGKGQKPARHSRSRPDFVPIAPVRQTGQTGDRPCPLDSWESQITANRVPPRLPGLFPRVLPAVGRGIAPPLFDRQPRRYDGEVVGAERCPACPVIRRDGSRKAFGSCRTLAAKESSTDATVPVTPGVGWPPSPATFETWCASRKSRSGKKSSLAAWAKPQTKESDIPVANAALPTNETRNQTAVAQRGNRFATILG